MPRFSLRRTSRPRRDPRRKLGRRGEQLARWWLRLRGYRILATRFRTPFAEVDLVAIHGPDLVLVEVKTRRHAGEVTVHPEQRARLARAALWLDSQYGRPSSGIRVDVVAVHGPHGRWQWPRLSLEVGAIGEEELSAWSE